LKTSIVVVVLGEGGSGGALAIGVGDRILMLENAVYSVITPEGCAAILWKNASEAARAAQSLKLTADELKKFGLIDEIIKEQDGWKYFDVDADELSDNSVSFEPTAEHLKDRILLNLRELEKLDSNQRIINRFEKFRHMGEWI